MPPKAVFNRDDIITTAFEIVKKSGFRDFSTRKIADELHSSTAPVYSYFSSMDDLRSEVLERAEKLVANPQAWRHPLSFRTAAL